MRIMNERAGFDMAAADTRSMLGWGVVAGPFYLIVGLVLALTRPGFDLSRHALSLLMLGDVGWIHVTNLGLSGLMTIVAAIGFRRALRGSRTAVAAGVLIGVYGVGLLGAAAFPPDPAGGFPPDAAQTASVSGVLHLGFGAVGFLALAAAAVVVGGWFARRGDRGTAMVSRVAAVVIVVGFAGGGALSAGPGGVASLWIAVVAGWAWLLYASIRTYRIVPHPVLARRV
jgi:hypothetical membrane protein